MKNSKESKIDAVSIQIEEVKDVVRSNISKATISCSQLDQMEIDSKLLLEHSKEFDIQTTILKKRQRNKNIKICVCVFCVIVITILILYFSLKPNSN